MHMPHFPSNSNLTCTGHTSMKETKISITFPRPSKFDVPNKDQRHTHTSPYKFQPSDLEANCILGSNVWYPWRNPFIIPSDATNLHSLKKKVIGQTHEEKLTSGFQTQRKLPWATVLQQQTAGKHLSFPISKPMLSASVRNKILD